MQQARAGSETILLKEKLHTGIHSNEMADKLVNEAAHDCCIGRYYDYDLSYDYTQPFITH